MSRPFARQLIWRVRTHQTVPKQHILRIVLIWLPVMHLVRSRGVVDAQEADLEVGAGVIEDSAHGLEAEVCGDRRHVQARGRSHNACRCAMQAHRDHLLERMLVGAIDVATRGIGIAVVMFVHILVKWRPVHQAMHWSVEHVVAHQEHPHSPHRVEQSGALKGAGDHRRIPGEEAEVRREAKLDEGIDEQVDHVSPVDWVLVRLCRSRARG
mmetsp:Transcript_18183/g.59478  ORF Transcript_18183/g.59478 Transcript_18183/m.59478 type:complete len:211 (-) Transcript_18183:186-818(-)|eukprot:scaffold1302_cov114-Isochrysis_galbana.AAC.8